MVDEPIQRFREHPEDQATALAIFSGLVYDALDKILGEDENSDTSGIDKLLTWCNIREDDPYLIRGEIVTEVEPGPWEVNDDGSETRIVKETRRIKNLPGNKPTDRRFLAVHAYVLHAIYPTWGWPKIIDLVCDCGKTHNTSSEHYKQIHDSRLEELKRDVKNSGVDVAGSITQLIR